MASTEGAASTAAVASLRDADENDDSDYVEEYENLDLSFDDIITASSPDDLLPKDKNNDDPTVFTKPHKAETPSEETTADAYILGTLIIRVVAARDLGPVHNNALGKMLFGSSRNGGGSTNPYAVVRFGPTTQRTSPVYDSTSPIWPRGETMYMDVTHPAFVDDDAPATTAKASKSSPKHSPTAASAPTSRNKSDTAATPSAEVPTRDRPVLTVALFHASDMGKQKYNPSKGPSGDSDDFFLGMTAINLTELLTGKQRSIDEWLPLSGGMTERRSTVRVVCEYEPSDAAPGQGDLVRFTSYCDAADLYPALHSRTYRVEECDADQVLLSWTSPEGWVSTFSAHRSMLICKERHQGTMDFYQDELVSLRQRLSHSPMIQVVQETVQRLPEEGLVSVGAGAVQGGLGLLQRWLQGGVGTAVDDIAFATNWDGRLNPNTAATLSSASAKDGDEVDESATKTSFHENTVMEGESGEVSTRTAEPLPNMPSCPITGEPMLDPVVAADGHTYERAAIARWLRSSNKSPLTGGVLVHKDLVPNYMLLSSLQERIAAGQSESPPLILEDEAPVDVNIQEDEEATSEVNLT